MKILSAQIENFASYKKLDFDFQNQGLTLIQGPTGSGKSTLCDIVPWILFGKTAKGGTVDEILSWNAEDDTFGTIVTDKITVTRNRGSANDLYFSWNTEKNPFKNLYSPIRGKDLLDTQRMINTALGMDYELYLAGAYFHEFSQTAEFFVTTAKNRRTICEQLVDLTLAKKLQAKATEEFNAKGKTFMVLDGQINTLKSNIDLLKRLQVSENTKAQTWEKTQEQAKARMLENYDKFEANRKKIISKTCPACRTVLTKPHEVHDDSPNPYLAQLGILELQKNPYAGNVKDYSAEIALKEQDLVVFQDKHASVSLEMDELEMLKQIVNDYRSASIENTIKDVEQHTNKLLTDHFDAEIKVKFDVADADKLDVEIQKDGNICSYTQLSKGQRCLLKLCFGVAVMRTISHRHGTHFSQLFFDESLDGMSGEFKLKALGLLEKLSLDHESVFVVEHSSELKAAINNSYAIELINGNSELAKT